MFNICSHYFYNAGYLGQFCHRYRGPRWMMEALSLFFMVVVIANIAFSGLSRHGYVPIGPSKFPPKSNAHHCSHSIGLSNVATFNFKRWGSGFLPCSWASLVAQMVKNLPAMLETSVGSLGWEDPLEEGMATHFSILAWRIPCPEGHKELDTTEWLSTAHHIPGKGKTQG